ANTQSALTGRRVIADRMNVAAEANTGAGRDAPATAENDEAAQARVREAYGKLPLSFEANAGQTDPRVKFFARGDGYSLFLTSADAMLMLRGSGAQQRASTVAKRTKKSASAMLRMRLVGINPQARINGLDEVPGTGNYFKAP